MSEASQPSLPSIFISFSNRCVAYPSPPPVLLLSQPFSFIVSLTVKFRVRVKVRLMMKCSLSHLLSVSKLPRITNASAEGRGSNFDLKTAVSVRPLSPRSIWDSVLDLDEIIWISINTSKCFSSFISKKVSSLLLYVSCRHSLVNIMFSLGCTTELSYLGAFSTHAWSHVFAYFIANLWASSNFPSSQRKSSNWCIFDKNWRNNTLRVCTLKMT